MRYDCCKQCIKRRITCDKATPQCRKCIKKGLICSGIGKIYRFVEKTTPCMPPKNVFARTSSKELQQSEGRIQLASPSAVDAPTCHLSGAGPHVLGLACNSDGEVVLASSAHVGASFVELSQQQQQLQRKPFSVTAAHKFKLPLAYTLEILKPEQRMLFDHCKPTHPREIRSRSLVAIYAFRLTESPLQLPKSLRHTWSSTI